jgi:hypothetical protein
MPLQQVYKGLATQVVWFRRYAPVWHTALA